MTVELVFKKRKVQVQGKDKEIKEYFLLLDNGNLVRCSPVSYEITIKDSKEKIKISTWKDFDLLATEIK